MTELTVGSIWAKEGRKGVVDGEGRSSARLAMAAVAGMPDSAVVGLDRARGGAEEVWGQAREVGARRIELRRRRLAGARLGGGLLVLCVAAARLELEEGEARDG